MRSSVVLAITILAACSDGAKGKSDASIDTMFMPDSGPCPTARFFTGEYIDWDSTDTSFCGIFKGTFTVTNMPTLTNQTNPNGRFQICLPAATSTRVDITASTMASQCTTPVGGMYTMPGLMIADPAVIGTGQLLSLRDFTTARQPSVATLDSAKGHVFVHIDLTPQMVTLSAAHDTAQAFDGSAWAAGTTGINVFFPNVTAGTTMVTMQGGAVGQGTVPVEAGKITYITLVGM